MNKEQGLPSSHFSLHQSGTTAASKAWQLQVSLRPDETISFYGLIVLYDGPQGNDQIAGELAQRIQDTIRYHQQLLQGHKVSLTQEDFFEQCLQKVNSEINVFLRDVQMALPVFSWALAIAMLAPDRTPGRWQVFLSRFGEISAWLLHKAQLDTYKLITIFDSPDPITGAPGAQKYFKNIVSSSLSSQDQILLCTPNVFNYISLSEMKRFLVELSVKSAMRQLQNVMQEHLIDPVAAAFTFKLSAYKQAKASEVPTAGSAEESMHSLIQTQAETEKLLGTGTSLGVGSIQALTGKLGASLSRSLENMTQKPSVWRPLARAAQASFSLAQKAGQSAGKAYSKFRQQRGRKSPMGKSEYVGIHGTVAKVSWWHNAFVRPILSPLGIGLRRLLRLDRPDAMRHWARSPALYAGLVVLILIGMGSWRLYQRRQAYQATVAAAQTSLDLIKSNVDRIDSYLIVGREADAVQLASQAKASLEAISQDLPQFTEAKNALLAKLDEQQRRLRKEINVQNPVIMLSDLRTRLNSPAKAFVREGDTFLIAGEDPHTVVVLDIPSLTPTSRTIATDGTKTNALVLDGQTAYLLAGKAMVSVNIKTGETSNSTTTNVQNSMPALALYNSRVYGVVPGDQQIVRSNRLPNFSVFSPWLKAADAALASARDLAIDGSIYVLTDAAMLQYAQGEPVTSFKLDPVEPALTQGQALSYQPDNQFFFILEPKRLLVYRKNGKFLAQYVLPGQGSFADVLVDEKASLAYVLSDEQLLSFPVQLAP